MFAKELIDKWRENHPDTVVSENQLLSMSNNFLDLIGAWIMNDKSSKDKKPIYQVRLHYDGGITTITDVNEETATYEIMSHVFPNDANYKTCDLVAIYFDENGKKENVLGSLTIV